MKQTLNIFWFRRDLRLDDNHGLFEALQGKHQVLPIFIFDSDILERLPQDDARVTFIYETLQAINNQLQKDYGSAISIYFGKPLEIYQQLVQTYHIDTVYTNHDYEPYAIKRDQEVKDFLKEQNIDFKTYKDQVIFEKNDIVKGDGKPYLVYTPYMKQWKNHFSNQYLKTYDTKPDLFKLVKQTPVAHSNLSEMGFKTASQKIRNYSVTPELIQNNLYDPQMPDPDLVIRTANEHRLSNFLLWQASYAEFYFLEKLWPEFRRGDLGEAVLNYSQRLRKFGKVVDND